MLKKQSARANGGVYTAQVPKGRVCRLATYNIAKSSTQEHTTRFFFLFEIRDRRKEGDIES
jgi:hypothetical protein